MKVQIPTTFSANQNLNLNKKRKNPNFNGRPSYESLVKQEMISRELGKYNVFISNDWRYSNEFLMGSVLKVVKVFNYLFGERYLPSRLAYTKDMADNAYACYNPIDDTVTFNANKACFLDIGHLKSETSKNVSTFGPSQFSTKHPAHIFVHEFSHAAHYKNLESIYDSKNEALEYWVDTRETSVPSPFGKLISKYKLSNYAVQSNDMAEFLAERMSKDICGAMNNDSWKLKSKPDVEYSTIFDRKWKQHNACPQAYIDYFSQLVWKGRVAGAEELSDQVELFLHKKRGLVGLARKYDGTIEEVDLMEEPSWTDIINPLGNLNPLTPSATPTKLQDVGVIKEEVKKSFWQNLFNLGTKEESRLGIEKQYG